MIRERGQVLVEATLAAPVCLAVAVSIVDCGVLVRDRVAVAQAATRAAEARLAGDDPDEAARRSLPASMRATLHVAVRDDRIELVATSGSSLAHLAGRTVTHRSTVELAEAAR